MVAFMRLAAKRLANRFEQLGERDAAHLFEIA
jgi:hypothetical protein